MVFSAIYLTHHWIIDALVGWAVAAVAVALMTGARWVLSRVADGGTRMRPLVAAEASASSDLEQSCELGYYAGPTSEFESEA